MRALPYLLVFALSVFAAGLTACGGSGSSKQLISAADAGPLKGDFEDVVAKVSDHDCAGATQALSQAQAHVDSLPRDTSSQLVERIQDGLNTLRSQAASECVETTSTPTETTPTDTTPTETTPTDTTTTDTTQTDTVPTDTVPTDTTTETTTTPTPTPNPGATTVPDDSGGVPTP